VAELEQNLLEDLSSDDGKLDVIGNLGLNTQCKMRVARPANVLKTLTITGQLGPILSFTLKQTNMQPVMSCWSR
jgi:hypothetical protein